MSGDHQCRVILMIPPALKVRAARRIRSTIGTVPSTTAMLVRETASMPLPPAMRPSSGPDTPRARSRHAVSQEQNPDRGERHGNKTQGQQIEKTGRRGCEKPDENGRLGAAVVGE